MRIASLFAEEPSLLGADDRDYEPTRYYTDADTVRSVQAALTAMPQRKTDSLLDPQGIDGIWGPRTRAAVQHFNAVLRGWPDETGITAGTLESLRYAGLLGRFAGARASGSAGIDEAFAGVNADGSAAIDGASGNAFAGVNAGGSAAIRRGASSGSEGGGSILPGLLAGGAVLGGLLLLRRRGSHG